MAILKALFDRSIISSAEGFGQTECASSEMQAAIREWFDLYFQRQITETEDPCQRLPYAIVNKINKTTFAEYDSSIANSERSAKYQFIDRTRAAFDACKKDLLQWTLVGGEVFVKPLPAGDHFEFTPVRRDCYVVLSRGPGGNVTSVGTAEYTRKGSWYYTLLEKRSIEADGRLTIENKLFRSAEKVTIGIRVPLHELPQYEALLDEYTYPVPIWSVGLVYVKTPMVNCVDGSPDGICVYEPAIGLIHNANINERQLDDEFENGQNRIIVSSDMLRPDATGHRKLTGKVFTGVDDNPENVGITAFHPTLRDANYENRKQAYLRSCETLIGFKRGILSNVQEVQKTATEITDSAGDYSLTIGDFQTMYYDALQEALQLCDQLGQMFRLCDSSHWEPDDLSVTWGNGVLYDGRQEWADDLTMVQAGMLKPEIALAHKYDLPCDTNEDLLKIRERYMPELSQLLRE